VDQFLDPWSGREAETAARQRIVIPTLQPAGFALDVGQARDARLAAKLSCLQVTGSVGGIPQSQRSSR
jgi:hypothetical protein